MNRGLLTFIFQGQASFFDVHEKKTVIGFPLQMITGLINKIPALQRIKEHFLRRPAGSINEIIRFGGNIFFAGLQGEPPDLYLCINYSSFRQECKQMGAARAGIGHEQ